MHAAALPARAAAALPTCRAPTPSRRARRHPRTHAPDAASGPLSRPGSRRQGTHVPAALPSGGAAGLGAPPGGAGAGARLPTHAPPPPLPPALLARYTPDGAILGRGSFGTVLSAVDAKGRGVAVKMIPAPADDGRARGRAREELALLADMQACPEVVELLATFEDDAGVYVVTERCDGGDLGRTLRADGPLAPDAAASLAHDVLQVLAACHAAGVCLADVKPANVLLTQVVEGGRQTGQLAARVADFGCAQRVAPGARLAKRTGTPAYMAPELLMAHWGAEADVWGLGVVLYESIAGRAPFHGGGGPRSGPGGAPARPAGPAALMASILSDDVPFDGPAWVAAPGAADLVASLLNRDFNSRTSAVAALAHPWLAPVVAARAGDREARAAHRTGRSAGTA